MPNRIITREMLEAYIDDMVKYAITTIRARSLPEVNDSLKPSQRRGIWAMIDGQNITDSEATKQKCAAVVGRIIERYHMHGDSSAYDTLVPLACWFKVKEPILAPYGNFGTFLGDGAAAMRYTNIYFSKFGYEAIVKPLKESMDIVDWQVAANEAFKEPQSLPCMVPLLLINGTFGLAVGIATEIPSHNLAEVIDQTLMLMDNPNHEVFLIPDHCLPCDIIDTDWRSICNKGEGSYKARARIEVGMYDLDRNGKLYPALFILSVPDRVNYESVQATINNMIGAGKLPMVRKMLTESNEKEMKEIIVLNKGEDPLYVKELLYKTTSLQNSYRVNFEVIHDITPLRMSYTSYLQNFIEYATTILFRKYCNRIRDLNTTIHQVDAYVKVLKSGKIDKIISMIRDMNSTNITEIINWLVKNIGITPLQAKYITDLKIPRLSAGYLQQYDSKLTQLQNEVADMEKYITDVNCILLKNELRDILLKFKSEYGKPRTCRIISAAEASSIPQGKFKLVITNNSFLRKLALTENVTTVKGDMPKFVMEADNTGAVLLFDNKGKVFKLLIHKIPICMKNMSGTDVRQILKNLTASIIGVIDEELLKSLITTPYKNYIISITEGNCIKRLDLEDFLSIAPSGILYTKLNDMDFVKNVLIASAGLDIIVYSTHKALRMNIEEIPIYKRNTLGVNAIAMNTPEPIMGMSLLYPDSLYIIAVTQSGYINKVNMSALQLSKRYKAGSNVIKLHKNDYIVGIYGVNDNNMIRITTSAKIIDINVTDLNISSTVSMGTRITNDPVLSVETWKL